MSVSLIFSILFYIPVFDVPVFLSWFLWCLACTQGILLEVLLSGLFFKDVATTSIILIQNKFSVCCLIMLLYNSYGSMCNGYFVSTL